MPVFHTDVIMIDLSEFNRAMSATSDRVFACGRAIVDSYALGIISLQTNIDAFYRTLYYTGVIDTPIHTHHPMTARKMRGAIRRLEAGEIGPNRVRPKVIAFMERSMRERPDIWQRLAES